MLSSARNFDMAWRDLSIAPTGYAAWLMKRQAVTMSMPAPNPNPSNRRTIADPTATISDAGPIIQTRNISPVTNPSNALAAMTIKTLPIIYVRRNESAKPCTVRESW